MPLPALKKTWQFSHYSNPLSGVAKADYDALIIGIKNALKSFGSTPCTVAGSSNGVAAGLDGVDRLVNTASMVYANPGSAHSWIVLNLVGMGSAQVLLELANPSTFQMGLTFSPAGLFTGGTTTASPTATDGLVIQSNGSTWTGVSGGTGAQFRAHIMRSTDGQNTRVFVCSGSQLGSVWSFEKAWNPVPGWTLPYCAFAVHISTAIVWNNFQNANIYSSWGPMGSMTLFGTWETAPGGGTNAVTVRLGIPNEISGEYPLTTIGLWHDTTVGQRGRHGSIPDMYFTAVGSVIGDTFPADGSKQFVQMGPMVVPSDGTPWLIS